MTAEGTETVDGAPPVLAEVVRSGFVESRTGAAWWFWRRTVRWNWPWVT